MSMPQPVHVALVGRTADIVRRAKKHFRLTAPGIGAAYLAALEPEPSALIRPLDELPKGLITVWVALDDESFTASLQRHQDDRTNARYSRGFYDEHLPEPCILVDLEGSSRAFENRLAELAQRVVEAWYATS